MKYAHLADLHLGSWREQRMRDLSLQTFLTAIDDCLKQQVDFILFAGDLFNTSLPSLDTLKEVTKKLKELQEKNVPLYALAGSHDFSPSGKTMLDVLENAGLLINVCKGTIDPETKELHLKLTVDPKTGTKITGVLGRRGLLDKSYYQNLNRDSLESESGYKIFMFHTTLTELKPKQLEMLESQPVSFLPKNFNYYAGGHLHHPVKIELDGYGTLTYPGALFPNNFAELEQYGHGGYYLIEVNDQQQKIAWLPIKIIDHLAIRLNCQHQTPAQIETALQQTLADKKIENSLITIRLSGTLSSGRLSDLNFNEITTQLYSQGAYFVMKNLSRLQAPGFEEIKTSSSSPELVEEQLISEHLQQVKLFDSEIERELTKNLLMMLNITKKEGETVTDFQNRIVTEMNRILGLEKIY